MMPRYWSIVPAALALTLLTLTACIQPIQPAPSDGDASDGAPAGEEITLYVGPELAECVGAGPMECMLVKENPADEYEFFYSNIDGFTFEPGYEYELRVLVEPVENPPADASSLQYTLIEEVSKTPVEPAAEATAEPTAEPTEEPAGEAATATPAAGEEADAPTLEETVWEAVAYVDAEGVETETVPGAQPTIRLEDDQVGGTTGCNNYFGAYTLDDDQLSFGQLGSTMMACPEPLMSQESGFLSALDRVASYTLEGETLTMLDEAGEPVLVFQPQQHLPLVGTDWQVTFYNDGLGFTSVIIDSELTALFDEEGNVGGTAGCNGYGAAFSTDGHTIEIGPAITTMMFCEEPEGLMEQEQAYLAALETAATYDIQAGTLTLFDEDGARAVEYAAVAEEEEAAGMEDDPAARLGNMTLPNEFGLEGEVQLEDGLYIGPPAAPGSASRPTVALTDFTAAGEIDGMEAVAAVLVASGGGSGSFYDLVVVQGPLDDPAAIAVTMLGDRVEINALTIEDDQIVIDMVIQGPDDPMCCPSQNVIRTYALEDGELVQTSEEIVGEAAESADAAGDEEADAGLEGVIWQGTSFADADGAAVDVLADAPPTMQFEGGQVSGTTGCNRFSGSYTVDGESLSFGPLAITAMACMGPVAEQEVAFLAALDRVVGYSLTADGMLELVDDEGDAVATFTPQVAPSLTGVTWSATGYNNGNEAVVSLVQGTEITAIFDEEDRLAGSAGCNQYQASYSVDGDAIQIGPAATTRMLCPDEIMEQEQAYLAALELAAVYQIEGDRLQIRDADGALLADYRALDEMTAETETETEAETEAETEVADEEAMEPADEAAAAMSPLPDSPAAITLDTGALADSYHWRIQPATPYDGDVPAPGGLPEHVIITFDSQTPEMALRDNGPLIYLLPLESYAATWSEAGNETIAKNVAALEALLAERPENPPAPLPLLPPPPAVNDLAVQTGYVDAGQFPGLRYVGRFVQDAAPATDEQFHYYFQGVSDDGQLYVSMRWPVTTPALPTRDDVTQADQEAMAQDVEGYLAEATAMLNDLAPADWRPDLAQLDALVASLSVTPPENAGDATDAAPSDELVGPIWAWQQTASGDDSVTTVDEPSRYTIQFMADGTAAIQADCNRVGAQYTAEGSGLQIETTMSTMALCPPDSLDQQFLEELSFVRSYVMEAGNLYLSMLADGGIMEFAPRP